MSRFDRYYPNPSAEPEIKETHIPGLFEVAPVVHKDPRGDFCVTWSVDFATIGAARFVQHNRAVNVQRATRGIHAEPWDKYVLPAEGEFFAAIVDTRPDSPTFGDYETFLLDPGHGIFVPQGCGNSYQTLSDRGVYSYFVGGLWHPELDFDVISCYDPELRIPWPYSEDAAIMSERDRTAGVSFSSIRERAVGTGPAAQTVENP